MITNLEIILYGMIGGCLGFLATAILTALFFYWLASRSPFQPEEEFINDHLTRQRYGNGRIQPNQTTEEK